MATDVVAAAAQLDNVKFSAEMRRRAWVDAAQEENHLDRWMHACLYPRLVQASVLVSSMTLQAAEVGWDVRNLPKPASQRESETALTQTLGINLQLRWPLLPAAHNAADDAAAPCR